MVLSEDILARVEELEASNAALVASNASLVASNAKLVQELAGIRSMMEKMRAANKGKSKVVQLDISNDAVNDVCIPNEPLIVENTSPAYEKRPSSKDNEELEPATVEATHAIDRGGANPKEVRVI